VREKEGKALREQEGRNRKARREKGGEDLFHPARNSVPTNNSKSEINIRSLEAEIKPRKNLPRKKLRVLFLEPKLFENFRFSKLLFFLLRPC
jgi:hypothetical protein